jgi:membrane protease YdiL (CAAX protease family)
VEQALLNDIIERVAARHLAEVATVISEFGHHNRHCEQGQGREGQTAPAMFAAGVDAGVLAGVELPRRELGTSATWRPAWSRGACLAIVCLVAVTGAELVVTLVNPAQGVVAHGVILAVLLAYGAFGSDTPDRRLAQSLAVAPIIRITSLGLPLSAFSQLWRFAMAGLPLLVVSFVLLRVLALSRSQVALRLPSWRHWPTTLLVAASGLPLGWAEYHILRPQPLLRGDGVGSFVLVALILLIATGVTEEIIFRGILQASAVEALGLIPGVVFVSLLFGMLHIGYRSVTDVVFVFGVALYFGAVVHWTRTLLGVTLAHGVTNIVLFAVLPLASLRLPLP